MFIYDISINFAASSGSFFIVRLIDVYQLWDLLFAELPVDVSSAYSLVHSVIVLVLEKIHTVPSENDSAQVDQLYLMLNFSAVHVKMSSFV